MSGLASLSEVASKEAALMARVIVTPLVFHGSAPPSGVTQEVL